MIAQTKVKTRYRVITDFGDILCLNSVKEVFNYATKNAECGSFTGSFEDMDEKSWIEFFNQDNWFNFTVEEIV